MSGGLDDHRPVLWLVRTGRPPARGARARSVPLDEEPTVSMTWRVPCPFHDEGSSVRSLTVKSDGSFHCRVCSAIGRAEAVSAPVNPLDLACRHIITLELENRRLRERLEPGE